MEDLTQLVALNLKKIREDKKLSLDKLSELTGVSKSMLGQIERGDSSPTIATVWKIANGLKVSFTSLLETPQSDTTLLHQADITPLLEDGGKYRLYPFFPIEEGRRFEVYTIEIDPGGQLSAEAHPQGTQEFITLFTGQLTVRVDQQEYRLAHGDSIRFRADRPHAYQNSAATLVKFSLVIHYT
ncbi:MAG: XRE family transcriptional regulator [Anaerolineaceae bacterium]|nr:XRE family transcriptional regulator [Anaerolineaceae bacterium]